MRAVRSLAWVALLVIGALAIAGLVVSLDHPPSGDERPEMTGRDAAVLAPRLAALQPSLEAMATEAEAVAAAGREALAALRAGDAAALPRTLDAGDAALERLTSATARVRDAAPGLLAGLGDGSRLPAADRERVAAVGVAVDGVEAIADAWLDAGTATLLPAALVAAVADHATAVERVMAAGRSAAYADAAAAVADAGQALDGVRAVRDRIVGAGLPVATLDGLVGRLADRDAALGALYVALAASDGVRTAEVDDALASVEATRAALDEADEELAVAVGQAGTSDITAALLVIDDGRGAIQAALGDR
jgi:hypothetical protein